MSGKVSEWSGSGWSSKCARDRGGVGRGGFSLGRVGSGDGTSHRESAGCRNYIACAAQAAVHAHLVYCVRSEPHPLHLA